MKTFLLLVPCAGVALAVAACNSVGTCPSSITPGASCSADNLSCPYTITRQSASATCQSFDDGGPVATSCTCSGGQWVCPSCDDGAGAVDASSADAPGEGSTDARAEAGDAGHD